MSEIIYKCSKCGVVSTSSDHLCSPREQSGREDYCGTAPERGNMCEVTMNRLSYVCGGCGRPAEEAELVCKPRFLG